MWADRISNPEPLALKCDALPTALNCEEVLCVCKTWRYNCRSVFTEAHSEPVWKQRSSEAAAMGYVCE